MEFDSNFGLVIFTIGIVAILTARAISSRIIGKE